LRITIVGDRYTIRRDSETVEEGTFRIDPTRRPRTLDAIPMKPAGKIQRGIYEWDGQETLRICFTHPGDEYDRPTQFSTTKGTGHTLMTARREQSKCSSSLKRGRRWSARRRRHATPRPPRR
jgi:uncharacterized protein (TIGR03067 family)